MGIRPIRAKKKAFMNFIDTQLADWKLVYRILHGQLSRQPDLLDSPFFEALQGYLQRIARQEGVDGTDHGAWDEWLGNQAGRCTLRN